MSIHRGSYHERARMREAAARVERNARTEARLEYARQIIREFQDAYELANGKPIDISYTSGWARSRDFSNPYRLSELERMTKNLIERANEQAAQDALLADAIQHETELGEAE
jgi:hypothetical protein